LVSQPDYGEQALDITQAVLFSGMIDVVVIDSVTALVPKADIDGDFTDANMGAHARLMSKMCRTLTPVIGTNGIILIAINQIRMKIGVSFGSPETTTGGKALKFYSGMRLRISSSQMKKGDTVDNSKRLMKIKFAKQKWGTPFREVEEVLELGVGFDEGFDMLQYGLREGIVVQNSSFYRLSDGTSLGNGKSIASQALLEADNKEKFRKLMEEKHE
jgi:recombination protein RecA